MNSGASGAHGGRGVAGGHSHGCQERHRTAAVPVRNAVPGACHARKYQLPTWMAGTGSVAGMPACVRRIAASADCMVWKAVVE